MKKKKLLNFIVTLFLLFQLHTWAESGKIAPRLLFEKQAKAKNELRAVREFALDNNQNIYIFDYMSNHIYKFDQQGRLITRFGRQGKGEKDFKHLTAIEVQQGKLMALDSIALFTFDLKGNFIARQSFAAEVLCEFPKILGNYYFMGEQIVSKELKKVLTLRNQKGEEIRRLDSYELKDYFPDLEEGKDFFLNDTYARFYLYDSLEGGSVIWAASDNYCLSKVQDNKSLVWLKGRGTPVPFPQDQQKKMAAKRDAIRKNMPSLHMYVPTVYPLIQKLFVGEDEVWIFLMSQERKGLVRYSATGEEIGFYTLEADFDSLKARIQIHNKKLYFLVPERQAFKMYITPVPK
jgi:hypothetical protein